MLRLPREAEIIIDCHADHQEGLSVDIETYLTEIRTLTRLNNIRVQRSPPSSNFSFRDHLTDHVDLVFNLSDDPATRDQVEKHEARLSKQIGKLQEDIAVNEAATKFHQENNDLENVERGKRRHETLLEDVESTSRRHENFVQLAQKRTMVEKKNKTATRS